jgi:hypothetical protein
LPGCVSQGDTRADALANIRGAIELYLEDCRDAGDPIPIEAGREFVEVEAAQGLVMKLSAGVSGRKVRRAHHRSIDPQDDGSAAQAGSGGSECLAPGGLHHEFVERLADDRVWGATLCGCSDLRIPRVICVFDTAIRVARATPLVTVQMPKPHP